MNTGRIKELLSLPTLIVGAAIALATIFAFWGSVLKTPERLDEHIQLEMRVHALLDSSVSEIDEHSEDAESLLNSLIRGECIENPRENLARQGLIVKCQELGITPR